jgi:hypothetical protein
LDNGGLNSWKKALGAGTPNCDPSTVGKQVVGIKTQALSP